jgi:hypothetical protein
MIDFLAGALAVLAARGSEIVEKLEKVTKVPPSVTEHCQRVVGRTKGHLREIKDQQVNLQRLRGAVAGGRLSLSKAEPFIKGYLKGYHDLRRKIDAIEEFFAGHVTRFSPPDEFLTLTASAIWREGNLPGGPPVAIASTSGYFCTFASLGIVFAPPNDVQKLLILPDLYHEFVHLLHENSSLLADKPRFSRAVIDYTHGLEQQARQFSRPLPPELTTNIYLTWSTYWAEEVACDTLAARLAGPAYGWCNLHLCIRNPKIYSMSKHPADAARTRHIFRVLRRCGWAQEAADMERRWEQYVQTIQPQKPANYDDYHADELFIAVMEDVEASTSGVVPTYQPRPGTVGSLLNEAWKNFLNDPLNYPVWEKPAVEELSRKMKP